MQPRLKSSTKWTDFPAELIKQILNVLKENFPEAMKDGKFRVSGRIYPHEILFCINYSQESKISHANSEVSIEYDHKKENVESLIHLALDAAGTLMQAYFEDEFSDLPRQWQSTKSNGKLLHWQFTTTNADLEAQADAILGIETQEEEDLTGMVKGDFDQEEIDALKRSIGLNPEDEDH